MLCPPCAPCGYRPGLVWGPPRSLRLPPEAPIARSFLPSPSFHRGGGARLGGSPGRIWTRAPCFRREEKQLPSGGGGWLPGALHGGKRRWGERQDLLHLATFPTAPPPPPASRCPSVFQSPRRVTATSLTWACFALRKWATSPGKPSRAGGLRGLRARPLINGSGRHPPKAYRCRGGGAVKCCRPQERGGGNPDTALGRRAVCRSGVSLLGLPSPRRSPLLSSPPRHSRQPDGQPEHGSSRPALPSRPGSGGRAIAPGHGQSAAPQPTDERPSPANGRPTRGRQAGPPPAL